MGGERGTELLRGLEETGGFVSDLALCQRTKSPTLILSFHSMWLIPFISQSDKNLKIHTNKQKIFEMIGTALPILYLVFLAQCGGIVKLIIDTDMVKTKKYSKNPSTIECLFVRGL